MKQRLQTKRRPAIIPQLIGLVFILLACDDSDSAKNDEDNLNGITQQKYVEYIETEMAREEIPGIAVAFITGGQTVWQRGFGVSNIETQQPVTPDTPFPIASVSKTFIGTILMQLEENGDVNLDDDINSFDLPFTVAHPGFEGNGFPLKNLANHTSGIVDNFEIYDCTYYLEADNSSLENAHRPGSCPNTVSTDLGSFLEAYLSAGGQYYDTQANFARFADGDPSTRFTYSNIGAALAAYAVETKTGTSFSQLCENQIFTPLGMNNTHWFSCDFEDPSRISRLHTMMNGQLIPLPPYSLVTYPDGGLRSSAADLARFLAAISNGGVLGDVRIMSEASVLKMISSHTDDVDMGEMGKMMNAYGTFWGDNYGLLGHHGGDPGITTSMLFDPKLGAGFVLLINMDAGALPGLGGILTKTVELMLSLHHEKAVGTDL